MRSFSAIGLLRWACVLPAAAIAAIVTYHASGIISLVATSTLGTLATPALAYWTRFALFYVPKKAAFVIGGTLTAPRFRVTTAIALAAATSIMSLLVHVLGQRTVGLTNYLHFSAETAGAVLGAICIAFAYRPAVRPTTKQPSPLPLRGAEKSG